MAKESVVNIDFSMKLTAEELKDFLKFWKELNQEIQDRADRKFAAASRRNAKKFTSVINKKPK